MKTGEFSLIHSNPRIISHLIRMIPDISDYHNVSDIIMLFFAILTVDVSVLFLIRYFPNIFGQALNDWYSNFQLNAILSDVLIILLVFIVARYIYTEWIKPMYGWNPALFIGLLVLLQVIHDVLFYLCVILPIPVGKNAIIDLFKRYSRGGPVIIGGDSLLMIASALVAFYYKSQPDHIVAATGALVAYHAIYILNTKPSQ
jgi:hypothetical protein